MIIDQINFRRIFLISSESKKKKKINDVIFLYYHKALPNDIWQIVIKVMNIARRRHENRKNSTVTELFRTNEEKKTNW